MNNWCEHIEMGNNIWIVHTPDWTSTYPMKPEWNRCPICGAPRPEEKKELWEVIEKVSLETPELAPNPEDIARTAKAWFIERIKNETSPENWIHIKRAIGYEEKT